MEQNIPENNLKIIKTEKIIKKILKRLKNPKMIKKWNEEIIDSTYLQTISHPIDIFPILSCLKQSPIP